MVHKAVITTILLLSIYSLFITLFRSDIRRTAQTVEQRNIVKSEEFLYENGTQDDTIVVGSSMTNRLLFDSLPGHAGHYYNLGLEGMASVDGLHLVTYSGYRPKLVMIETNTMNRWPDTTFFTQFTEPGWSQVRRYIPFMRLRYQPVGVVKALLRDWRGGVSDQIVETIDTAFVTKLIRQRLSQITYIPNNNDLQATINQAAVYIKQLQQRGTQLIFFEMPIDPRLRDINMNVRLRKLVSATFPDSVYRHIPFPSEHYQTTDGTHMPRTECVRYASYLCRQLAQPATKLPR